MKRYVILDIALPVEFYLESLSGHQGGSLIFVMVILTKCTYFSESAVMTMPYNLSFTLMKLKWPIPLCHTGNITN